MQKCKRKDSQSTAPLGTTFMKYSLCRRSHDTSHSGALSCRSERKLLTPRCSSAGTSAVQRKEGRQSGLKQLAFTPAGRRCGGRSSLFGNHCRSNPAAFQPESELRVNERARGCERSLPPSQRLRTRSRATPAPRTSQQAGALLRPCQLFQASFRQAPPPPAAGAAPAAGRSPPP